jgi:hypothetical protein
MVASSVPEYPAFWNFWAVSVTSSPSRALDDRFEEVLPSHSYGIIYYVVASLMVLATFFLLAWKRASRRPNTQEQLMIRWGPFIIGGCVILGAKSHCARRMRHRFLQPGPYLRRRNNEDKQSDP